MSKGNSDDRISIGLTFKQNKVLQTSTKTHFFDGFKRKTNFVLLLLTLYIVLSITCFASSNAQLYKGNFNDIRWSRFVAPSSMEIEDNILQEYDVDKTNDEFNNERKEEVHL